jgi:hypothetical protein
MSILSGIGAFFKIGKAASTTGKVANTAGKAAATVTKAGKTVINATKGSKIVLQMGEVGGAAGKALQTGFRASRVWILAKWGVAVTFVVGVGVAVKNILSGLFGGAYNGLSSILQGLGLSKEHADTGSSIIFIALFVAIILYALPYITDMISNRKPRPKLRSKVKDTAKKNWETLTTPRERDETYPSDNVSKNTSKPKKNSDKRKAADDDLGTGWMIASNKPGGRI